MKIVTPPKPIHTSEVVNDEIIITIPVKKRWFEMVWLLWFLIVVSPLLYFLGRALILYLLYSIGLFGEVSPNTDVTVNVPSAIGLLAVVVIILLLSELWLVYSLLWRFVGREIVSVNKDVFVITRKLFGWKPYKAYKTSDISALRISYHRLEVFSDLKSLFGRGGTIAFDYGAKSFQFANGLDEAEGRQIIKKIQLHLSNFLPQLILDGKGIGEYN